MKIVHLVYSTDAWHTHSSKELIGAYSSHIKAVKALKIIRKLNKDEIEELNIYYQTQGREENFVIEAVELDLIDLIYLK